VFRESHISFLLVPVFFVSSQNSCEFSLYINLLLAPTGEPLEAGSPAVTSKACPETAYLLR
jgi:hypothetical protein